MKFKDEFQFSHMKFGVCLGASFTKSEWPKFPHALFVLYRVVVAGYVLGWNIVILVRWSSMVNPPLVYLSQWAYVSLACYLLSAVAVVLHDCLPRKRRIERVDEIGFQETSFRTICHGCGHGAATHDTGGIATEKTDSSRVSNDCDKFTNSIATNVANSDDNEASCFESGCDSNTPKEFSPTFGTYTLCYVANSQPSGLNFGMKFCWFLHCISANLSILITFTVYLFIYPLTKDLRGFKSDLTSLNTHAINFILVLMDIFIIGFPVRILHALYPALIGIVYLLFSVAYWYADQENHVLYPFLDWGNPGSAGPVSAVMILGAVPLVQLLLYGLYQLRRGCRRRCFPS